MTISLLNYTEKRPNVSICQIYSITVISECIFAAPCPGYLKKWPKKAQKGLLAQKSTYGDVTKHDNF
ncbi:MAG TPA: hypothetical protein DCE81_03685 [Cytophagales bacterium]|nr:hypothetical protein [Cytophagales bacterium]